MCLRLFASLILFELFDPNADVRIDAGCSLPHWYQPGVTYFVTFRTEDSIPADVSRRWHARRADWLLKHGIVPNDLNWREQLSQLSAPLRREFHESFSREYLETLDKGYGSCSLRNPQLSQIVAQTLLHFDGGRYHLGNFVVMPNHVHVIDCLLGETEIVAQSTSWKRYSARIVNLKLGTKGRFWQEESFDHLIRTAEQFDAIQRYIRKNPRSLPVDNFRLYERK